ncbi:hypothetical protein KJ359_002897 [Pestalotiopsis sp. 9143b]|nr:hypothetical protein KJ359_002897 [Pestalotiopsis sp. 9143b]
MTNYLGDIENHYKESFRHSFYREEMVSVNAISMDDILGRSIERSLTMVEQLKTARTLAAAVLKFHETPWLNDHFSPRNIHFFPVQDDMCKSLQTLHLEAQFSQEDANTVAEPADTPMTDDSQDGSAQTLVSGAIGIEQQEAFGRAKLLHGVRNTTLWSLGIILLQIGSWSRIPALDDVVAVRDASSQVSNLGPKYQRLTKQCLDCDFGYGEDLSTPRLQQAVYQNIIGDLTAMMNSLQDE